MSGIEDLQMEWSRKAAGQCNPKPFTHHLSKPAVEELIAKRIKSFNDSITIELECGPNYPKIPLCVSTFIPKMLLPPDTISDSRAIALRDSNVGNTILLPYFEAVAGKIPTAEPREFLRWNSIMFVKKFYDSRPNDVIADTLMLHAMEYFMDNEVHLTTVSGERVAKTLGISNSGLDRQVPRILRRQIKGAVIRMVDEKSEAVFRRLYANLTSIGEADNDRWTTLVCVVVATTAFIEMRQAAFHAMASAHPEIWPLADCIKSCQELEILYDEIANGFLARFPGTQCHVLPEDTNGMALVKDLQAFSQSTLISQQKGELPDLHQTTWKMFKNHNSGRLIANFLTKVFQSA